MIELPKGAQHNTIGELPIVEVVDDGDFYEEDGAEYLTSQNCNKIISDECDKKFGKDHLSSTRCYLRRIKRCDDLRQSHYINYCAEALKAQCEYSFENKKPLQGSWYKKMPSEDIVKIFKEYNQDERDNCFEVAAQVCSSGTPTCEELAMYGFGGTCMPVGIYFK